MADGSTGISVHDAHRHSGTTEELAAASNPNHEGENTIHEDDSNDTSDSRHGRPSAPGLHPTEGSHGPANHQINYHRHNLDIESAPLSHPSPRFWVRLNYVGSFLDLKTTIRFIVIVFNYFLGFVTAYSVYGTVNRSDEALPSPRSDTYPVMVAQVAGSLLSPLLFGVVSIKDTSTPLRQKWTSFYFFLLALGVLMSMVSLMLYSLWPAGYRVNNVVTIASLMFAILGGWQSLEKDWKEAAETHQVAGDIELAARQS
ncbi:hypothetical protein F4818DRAFT_416242 [Hypoxylon cercidicola]|nr:hypothetical protein F4818DRAFT_416242 [Hypoxylon cercidicola]